MNTQLTQYPLDLTAPGAIDQLLAFHRQTFGDSVMEAEGETGGEQGGDGTGEGQPDDDNAEGEVDGDGDAGDDGDEGNEEELPAWARRRLTKANGEAARYRTEVRDLAAKLAEAKSPEDIADATAALQSRVAELEHEVVVRDVASEYKLPADLAAALKGSTKEELEAHAKVLAKYAPKGPTPPPRLGGGLDPTGADGDGPLDPRKLAGKRR